MLAILLASHFYFAINLSSEFASVIGVYLIFSIGWWLFHQLLLASHGDWARIDLGTLTVVSSLLNNQLIAGADAMPD